MLPINWLNNCEVPDVNVEILENFYNAYSTPKPFFDEKYFESWYLKIHSPTNYIQSFYVAALIYKCGTTKHYPRAIYLNDISNETGSSVTGKIDDVFPSSHSDSATISNRNKNLRDMFQSQMKKHCLSIKAQDDTLFRNSCHSSYCLKREVVLYLTYVKDP